MQRWYHFLFLLVMIGLVILPTAMTSFILSPDGGDATIVTSGGPLTSPDGVFVDIDNIAWVMDKTNQRAPSVAPCGR